MHIYSSIFLELDDFDQIEDPLVTAKKLKKPSNGSRSYMKYGMVDNLEPIPKKKILTDSSNSTRKESGLKPSDDSRDGRIVTFFSCLRFPNEPF